MKFLDFFRKKSITDTNKGDLNHKDLLSNHTVPALVEPPKPDWEGDAMTEEEREEVALVTAAIAAGAYPDSKFRIQKITPIDTNYEAAGIICAAIAAGDDPNSAFRIKSIKRVS